MHGVADEVGHDLIDFTGEAIDIGHIGVQIQLQAHLSFGHGFHDHQCGMDAFVDISHQSGVAIGASKNPQTFDDFSCSARSFRDAFEQRIDFMGEVVESDVVALGF